MSKSFNYQRLYDWMAPLYAPAIRLLPMWRRYTEAVLPWLPDTGTVLEIGPGPGVLLRTLADRYPVAIGLDLSPGMLHRAHACLRDAGFAARLVEGNAERLPFAPDSVDGIALTFAFSAFPDGQTAMREMTRVLRPGGVIALVDAADPGDRRRVAYWLARAWELFGDFMRDESALMEQAGLDVIERRTFGAFDSIRITVGRKPGET